MSPRRLVWNGLRVPFITPWSAERMLPGTIELRRGRGGVGIGYRDEYSRADRWRDALWVRVPARPGVGRPLLDGVHALRQRQAMNHTLCQVCSKSTVGTRRDERQLFVAGAGSGRPFAEGEPTTTPPLHELCALEAIRECPHLARGYVASLVEYTPAWGVAGIVYDPRTLRPLPSGDGEDLTLVEYDDPLIRWTLAARAAVTLHGCTPVTVTLHGCTPVTVTLHGCTPVTVTLHGCTPVTVTLHGCTPVDFAA
ncbi:hypothetical protein JK364_23305 [Streptomyces sp. 110]|uniref:Uncharacterized protein n=1 Tax=Streptomyces endocoffeicus TaxID=2898945 RepID=A0ABS1PU98_9ACTN|nr:hypothetical protein [Streptomyces endocoffeicus]MBL1115301.1 hypothetical protein [Streptomyces endocoffeicus]